MMQRFLVGIGALLAIAVIVVGVPIALIVVAGNPLPTSNQIHYIVTLVPDYGNVILLTKILPCLAWFAWLLFAVPLLIEIGAGIAGRKTTKRIWLLKGQQQAAAALVAAVLVMLAGFGAVHVSGPPLVAATPRVPILLIEPTNPAPSRTQLSQPTIEPAAAAVSASQAPRTQTVAHVVVPGDNLWDISEKYYGVGTRDLDIFSASTATVQPGGQRLTNPNLIRPGWRLTVPDVPVPPTVAAPAPDPAPTPNSAPAEQSGPHSPNFDEPVPAPASTAKTTPSTASTPSGNTDKSTASESDLAAPLNMAGGLVGLLAAALLLLLGRRRLNQRRRRRAGERIAMPEYAAADFEQDLRMVEDPLGLADIDNALRLLQMHAEDSGVALPELLAVRLVEQKISLYFIRPTDLPAPFEPLTSEHTVWTLHSGTVAAPSRAAGSPYPALVIIGVDDNDGVLLLDIEQLGVLNVLGDEDIAVGILNALAGELAANPWGEQIQVTLVGMPLALARSIDRFRIQHVDHITALLPGLQRDLERRSAALRSYGVDDVHAARALAAGTESWAPHIVLLAEAPDEPLRSQLAGLVARDERLGVAVIVNGEFDGSRATIRVDSSGRAELFLPGGTMPPLPFTPQLLRDRELELLQDLFDTTEKEAVHPATAERELASAPSSEVAAAPLEPNPLPQRQRDDFQDPNLLMHPEIGANPPNSELLEAEQTTGPLVPYLRFLGPVEATGVNPETPMPGRGIELMAYLLLRNGPIDGLQLQRAFWPDTPDAANNQRGLAKKVRVVLGHNPSGELFLPENINHHGYMLHPAIRSDWGDFRALVGDDPAMTSSDNLIAALRLVRGTPFAGSNTRRWWQWIAIPQEEMIAAIMDAADELGNRALEARNASLARYAARIEQAVDPLNEAGWRIELRAALQAGDTGGFNAVIDDLYARVGGDDADYEVDDDTQILIDQAHQKIHA